MRTTILTAVIFFCCGLLISCQRRHEVESSFYYWKTAYQANIAEQAYVRELGAKRLFIRIMDVDNQGPNGEAIPVSPIEFKEPLPDSVELVPVVFLVNNVLRDQSAAQLDDLAGRLYGFVQGKVKQGGKARFDELQIDCDWTAGTRDAYFYLLERLRELTDDGVVLSATLRLHQVRNVHSSGIPPVDRVLLMCYNMGNLRKFGAHNSILDMEEMETYLAGYLADYPLPLDVALPLFSWSVVFRGEQYTGISKRLDSKWLADTALFDRLPDSCLYRLKSPLPEAGLRIGDVIRREEIRHADLSMAADFLVRHLPRKPFTLLFYHLDDQVLTSFSYETLQEIVHRF